MSHNCFGKIFSITTFGESHGKAIGVVLDGVPPGLPLEASEIQQDLDRRRPGQSKLTTQRREGDQAEILSGVFEGKTTGAPVAIVIRNQDARSKSYDNLKDLFRPGHADYSYHVKYGHRDHRGGGRSSGRETACRVAAGAVAKKLLSCFGIFIQAATIQVKDIKARTWDSKVIEKNPVRCPDSEAAKQMEDLVMKIRKAGDSVGGVVECRVTDCPAGLGEPLYAKLDADLAQAMLSIGATRGVEFGDGWESISRTGFENNDQMDENGFKTNHTGGILGGISTGEPILFRVLFKPTASVSREQDTIKVSGEKTRVQVKGRHDPCILPRAVPVVEAMTAIVLADHLLRNRAVQVLRPDSESSNPFK